MYRLFVVEWETMLAPYFTKPFGHGSPRPSPIDIVFKLLAVGIRRVIDARIDREKVKN
jgi:hypothetical protein